MDRLTYCLSLAENFGGTCFGDYIYHLLTNDFFNTVDIYFSNLDALHDFLSLSPPYLSPLGNHRYLLIGFDIIIHLHHELQHFNFDVQCLGYKSNFGFISAKNYDPNYHVDILSSNISNKNASLIDSSHPLSAYNDYKSFITNGWNVYINNTLHNNISSYDNFLSILHLNNPPSNNSSYDKFCDHRSLLNLLFSKT